MEYNNGGPTTHAGGERYIELPAQPALCLEATVAEGELVDGVEGDDLWGVVHGQVEGNSGRKVDVFLPLLLKQPLWYSQYGGGI